MITSHTAYGAWHSLLGRIMSVGNTCAPRGKKIKELIAEQVIIFNGLENVIADPQRKLNYRFLVAQWLTTMMGLEDLPILENFNKAIASYESDGRGGAYPSYGPRLLPQWPFILQSLLGDHDSRQAVMSIWEAQGPIPSVPEGNIFKRYIPCTLSLQFLLRPFASQYNKTSLALHTIVTMRSSDAWLGLPYDIFNFSMLANFLAGSLSHHLRAPVEVGTLTLNLGSSHLYEEHWDVAASLANAPMGKSVRSPRLTGDYLADMQPWLELRTPTVGKEFPQLAPPWSDYAQVLTAENNMQALVILEGIVRQHAKV